MINEFRNIDLLCSGSFISPRNIGNITKYPTELGPNQVCSLVGSTPGNPIVTGNEYLFANFEYLPSDLWRNFAITLAFFFAFLMMQMYAAEREGAAGQSPVSASLFFSCTEFVALITVCPIEQQINVFAKESQELETLNEKLMSEKEASRRGELQEVDDKTVHKRQPLTWESLKCVQCLSLALDFPS